MGGISRFAANTAAIVVIGRYMPKTTERTVVSRDCVGTDGSDVVKADFRMVCKRSAENHGHDPSEQAIGAEQPEPL